MMPTFLKDLRFAARIMLKRPGLTSAIVLTLGLGIGANTAIFSIANALLLRPLPIDESSRVVQVFGRSGESLSSTHSYPAYLDLRDRAGSFSGLCMTAEAPVHLGTTEQALRIEGALVSGDYFTVLGVQPAVGRLLAPSDDVAVGVHPVAVISHDLWRRQFQSDPAVIGTEALLNGFPFTLIGVAAEEFTGIRMIPTEVWVPVMMFDALNPEYRNSEFHPLESRGQFWLTIVGRTKPGATVEQAEAEVTHIFEQLNAMHPDLQCPQARLIKVDDCRMGVSTHATTVDSMQLLMAAVGLVLLIACANVTNLLMAQARARRREIAIRVAVGAGRAHVAQRLLTESVLLALMGGGVGLLLSVWLSDLLLVVIPESRFVSHRSIDLSPDARVLGFTFGTAVLTGVLVGLVPMLQSQRVDPASALRAENATTRSRFGQYSLQHLLATAQVSVSLILVIAAVLLARTWSNMRRMDPGFEPHGVLLASLDVSNQGYDEARAGLFYKQLLTAVEAIPGVRSVALADRIPMHEQYQMTMKLDGYESRTGRPPMIPFNRVSSAYFSTMNIPLLRGRSFASRDRSGAPRVAVVNEAMAKRYWGGDALGKKVMDAYEVVGIVANGKYHGLREDPRPFVYFSLAQRFDDSVTLVARTADRPRSVWPAIQAAVRELDPALPLFDVESLDDHLGSATAREQMAATLFGVLGAVALALVSCGLYGVMSYGVTCRTREFGIRVALGAERRHVLRLVLWQGTVLTALGVAAGVAIAAGLTRALQNRLFGVTPTDPATFILVAALLTVIALTACYLPARRATKVDPVVALRCE